MKALGIVLGCLLLAGCAGTPPAPTSSHTREIAGPGAVVTVLEGFDGGPAEVQLSRRIDTWGEHITDTRSSIDIVDAGGGGKAARYSFTAAFDAPFSFPAWKDTGLAFVGMVELPAPSASDQGLAFSMKPEGFTSAVLYLVQEDANGTRAVQLPVFANDGAWKDWRIPFSAFRPGNPTDPALDMARPVRFEVYIPWQDNWEAWHFRTGAGADAAFSLDTLGYWRPTVKDDGRTIVGWSDERDLAPFSVYLYGTSLWTDYSASDNGIVRLNAGVTGQKLGIASQSGGPEGDALVLTGRVDLTRGIGDFHKAGQVMTVYMGAPISLPLAGGHALSFLVRSDIAPAGHLEIQDQQNDRYYGADFAVISSWTRVRIPYDRILTDKGSLATADKLADRVLLRLSFDLPPGEVERAAAAGVLEFTISLDSLTREP
jgi:hypothetical protein